MGRGYFVYDPLTKKCIHIHSFLEVDQEKHLYVVGFLSQTLISTRCFWVVIMNSFIRRLNTFRINVFSSEMGIWRQIVVYYANGFAFAPH